MYAVEFTWLKTSSCFVSSAEIGFHSGTGPELHAASSVASVANALRILAQRTDRVCIAMRWDTGRGAAVAAMNRWLGPPRCYELSPDAGVLGRGFGPRVGDGTMQHRMRRSE